MEALSILGDNLTGCLAVGVRQLDGLDRSPGENSSEREKMFRNTLAAEGGRNFKGFSLNKRLKT